MARFENVSSIVNDTTGEPPSSNPSLYPYSARIAVACVWFLVAVLGLVGNSLVIFSVFLSKRVRSITNVFVINLGVADFWTSMCYPWQVVAILSNDVWPLATEVPCVIAAVQLYTGLGASLYSLAAIAFNRFMLVTQTTHTYRRWFSCGKVASMIAVTWFVPFVVFFLPPVIGVGDFGYDPQDNTCSDKDAHIRGPEYNLAQLVGMFPIPLFIITCCYTGLYIYLRRHFKKRAKYTSQTPASIGETTLSLSVANETSVKDQVSRHKKAISRQQVAITKNLFIVFCVFTLLMSPYFISLALGPISRKFALYGATIMIINSAINPIIYAVSHPQFKVVLREMILFRFSEISEPTDWLKFVLSRNN